MRHLVVAFAATACALHSSTAPAAETHPFSVHDMLAMDRISDPQVSPDNGRVVFVLRITDLEANKGRTDLWLVNIDGNRLRRLTSHPGNDWNPRWSPNGRTVWFLSTRSGSSQVWRIHVDGGEAEQVTDEPLDIGSLAISPTGEHIAVSMEVFPDTRSAQETRARLDEMASRKETGRVFEQLLFRHWDRWKDGRVAHIFVLPADGGEPVDVMQGMSADCPTRPFGGPGDFTFTPDGSAIVFTARNVGRKEAWSTDFDLYVASHLRPQHPVCLTKQNEAWDAGPVFSPDGRTLAYRAMSRPGYESDRFRIVLRPWHGVPDGSASTSAVQGRTLAANWDRSAGSIVWSTDGRQIYTTASSLGQRSLFSVDVATGAVRTIVRDGTVGAVRVAGGRLIYGLDTLHSPVELWSIRPDGADARQVTRINADRVAAARMGAFEQFTFSGWNNEPVHAYVVKPAGLDAARRYPVAFLIHGGPQGSFGNHFHYRWNPQVYAGAGYAAVMVDFHGSTGYGQAFCDSIRGDWGGKPLVDLKKGLAAALERYPWMDGDRVAALGASFGGYMINWIAGNWPDRFRCLVNHDGNLDERAAYFDTEELWFPEWDHGGTPWANPDGYERHNPINYVRHWKTPMLVIHGAKDFRVVETQGMSTFTALQRLGIPSKFLYYPDENHWVLRPANSIQWHETVIGWLDQWTK